jgi:NAD+ kinase
MKKLCFIWKKESKENHALSTQFAKELKAEGHVIIPENQIEKADLVIPVGGDGTILRAIRLIGGRKIPVLGVYSGGLGFLTEVSPAELAKSMQLIREKKYVIDERTGLTAQIMRGNKTGWSLNDVALTKTGIARVLSFDVLVGKTFLGSFKADGAIISSATGSTAYNLSLNGPILSPNSPDLIFNPICSHSLAHRPVVTHSQVELILTNTNEAALTLDGQIIHPLKKNDHIVVSRSKQKAYFVRMKKYDLFETLRLKMGWG